MNDNMPPLPPEGFVWNDPEHGDIPAAYTAEQMQAYARAAIERQSVPDLNRLTPFVGGLGKAILQELIEDMAAAPQPQPVQEPVKGWWAHTCPEDGKVDVVNYQLTPADKRAGWVEHEVYTSPQAQPLSDDASPIFVLLAVEESIKNGECPWQIEQAFDEYEAQRQSEITKGEI